MTIPAKAVAKQSAKFANGHAFTPAKQKKFVNLIKRFAELEKPEELFEGNLELQIVVSFAFRKSEKKAIVARGYDFCNVRPDFDNISKPICDALTGILYQDDGRIAVGKVTKLRTPEEFIYIQLSKISFEEI